MHATARRSREALRAAVLELAARRDVGSLSVSEICTRAGVTRDTFYRHAQSPVGLLADALGAELDHLRGEFSTPAAVGSVETAILNHVVARLAVYRGAMRPVLPAEVRDRLERLFADGLTRQASLHPEILPPRLRDERAVGIAVAYAASGAVGAIEAWLRTADGDVADVVDIILAASPSWWIGRHEP